MWHGSDGMGWWMVFDGLFWLVVLGMVFVVVARALERGPRGGVHEPKDALEIAERRYARGEIGADELAEIRHNLAPPRPEAA